MSPLDLGPLGRSLFCAVFFGSEALLVATASCRTDRSYGFRMFPESSAITVHLWRRVNGDDSPVRVVGGRWRALDCAGAPHTIEWGRMVLPPGPWRLDAPVAAPYGVDSEVHRTRDALRWVLTHTPQDCETRALFAKIEASRNGRAPYEIELEDVRGR